jgi:PAS domain S-box-containing protein
MEAVVLTDRKGHIQYVNSAFERVTGYSKEEALGRSLHILDSGSHDGAFFEGMRKALAREGKWSGRLISRKKDGTLFYEDCTHSVLKGPSGDIVSRVWFRSDVTDRLKLEAVAEEVDSVRNTGYVFSGARHEIGNAVNSLAMILGVLKAKLHKLDKPAVESYVDRAMDQASKAASILRRLKPRHAFTKTEIQAITLPEFMAKFHVLVRDDCFAKGIKITSHVDADAERCYADPLALHQVMLNLLVNALDAVEGREHPRVSIAAMRSGEGVMIRMEDNGCGMSEGQLRDIFKPFYTTKDHGTGLGLVIVKKLLAGMNGSIEISSRKDVGTTVDVTIPSADPPSPAHAS